MFFTFLFPAYPTISHKRLQLKKYILIVVNQKGFKVKFLIGSMKKEEKYNLLLFIFALLTIISLIIVKNQILAIGFLIIGVLIALLKKSIINRL